MGLYDYINGEQIKIFYNPIFNEQEQNTWHSGGTMINYDTGEPVPTKTLYYNRPKTFLVFDEYENENEYETKHPLLHIIKDGVVSNTIDLQDATNDLFVDNILVLNYYGHELNVKSKEDCYNFIKDTTVYEDTYWNTQQPIHNIIYNKLKPINWIKTFTKDSETVNKIAPTRVRKLATIFNGISSLPEIQQILQDNFSFNSLNEFQQSLATDDNLYYKFVDIIRPIAEEKGNQYNEEYEKLKSKLEPQLNKLYNEYHSKYLPNSPYTIEAQFGEYIECLRYMYPYRDAERPPQLTSNRVRYDALIETMKAFINTHNNIVDSYIKWLELNDVQAKYIKSICDGIFTNPNDLPIEQLQTIYEDLLKNVKTELDLNL